MYTVNIDVWILKEVVARNPFRTPTLWTEIASTLKRHFPNRPMTAHSCRERVMLLIQYFMQDDLKKKMT